MKFGGKSLATREKMQNVCKFIKNCYKNDKKLIVVVSAMGNATDNLSSLAHDFGGEHASERELAALLSLGENKSAILMALMLSSMNVLAKSFQGFQLQTTTFGDYNYARIAYINKSKLESCINDGFVAVVAGFQGINSENEITTFGRGGSDTTASAIGAIFNQDVEIYSDFDGIFAGDPRYLNFKKLKSIDYDSMIAIAKSGSKVIDCRATEIAKDFKISLISKASENPNKSGTIVSDIESDTISLVTRSNLCQISVIVSNKIRMQKTINNVFLCLKECNFYKFNINDNTISFLIEEKSKQSILSLLSKKLKILNK